MNRLNWLELNHTMEIKILRVTLDCPIVQNIFV